MELRHRDFSLDVQQAVRTTFAEFFTERSPSSVVRAAEPTDRKFPIAVTTVC